MTIGSVSYLPGMLITNTQNMQLKPHTQSVVRFYSVRTPYRNILISKEMQHVSQKQLHNFAKKGFLTNPRGSDNVYKVC